MPGHQGPRSGRDGPTTYQVRIAGQLGPDWEDWFEGLRVAVDGGDTLITGPVTDQAALHGLLRRVRDLGLPLVSITPINTTEIDEPCMRTDETP